MALQKCCRAQHYDLMRALENCHAETVRMACDRGSRASWIQRREIRGDPFDLQDELLLEQETEGAARNWDLWRWEELGWPHLVSWHKNVSRGVRGSRRSCHSCDTYTPT